GTKPGKMVHAKAAFSEKGSASADAAVLSSGEIADRIARSPEELPAIRERLRHWTREGLLVPIGDRKPGSGKHRRYETPALLDAAILNILADHGIPVVGRDLLYALARTRVAGADWQAKQKAGIHYYLQIASVWGKSGRYRRHAEVYESEAPHLP